MKKLTIKNTKPGLYISAFLCIASALLMAVMIGMSAFGLTQTRRVKLIVQTETVAKVYDGEPLMGPNFNLIYGRPAMGHTMKVLSYAKQDGIGQIENRIEFIIVDMNGTDVTNVYDIEQRCGTLTVANREVVVRMNSAKKTYDGTPLSDSGWRVVSEQRFAEGHTLQVYSSPEITEVGTVANAAAVRVVDEQGNDVSDQYILSVEDGELEITPRPLTVVTGTASKLYDGTPLLHDEWRLSSGDVLEGHTLHVSCVSQITEVGTKGNDADVTVRDARGVNVTAQYDVQLTPGELTVEPIPLYVHTADASRVYDGTSFSDATWRLTAGELNSGDIISVISSAEIVDVGQIPNRLAFIIRDETGRDVTSRYAISQTLGTLRIEPRRLVVRTGTARKPFDGSPLTADHWDLMSGSLCIGHTMTVVGSARTEIGTSDNMMQGYSIYRTEGGRLVDVTNCYQVTFACGTLTVTP